MLFGVHAFWWHPITVWVAWVRLYRRIPDWAETVAIVCHDNYWGLPNIDGPEGKQHPAAGARLARFFGGRRSEALARFHSRSFSEAAGRSPSALCAPDKASIYCEPPWFYMLRARLSGELEEFIRNGQRERGLTFPQPALCWFRQYRESVDEEFMNVIYLPLGGGNFAKVDSDAPVEILGRKWSANKKTPGRLYAYRSSTKYRTNGQTHTYLHHVVLGVSGEVDHINGDTLDNRRANLRKCLHSENGRNLRKWSSPTSSRYKGVCLRPHGRWQGYICFKSKQVYLGLFDSEENAARAYDVKARELFGEFARLNFPPA